MVKNTTNRVTVLVGGCFDLFHYGHLVFLTAAKKQGTHLIVALEPDEAIERRKKRKPVHTQEQRAAVLRALHVVDEVMLLPLFTTDAEYFALTEKIRPAVIAITKGDPQEANKRKQAERVGGKVVVVTDRIPGFSSSKSIV